MARIPKAVKVKKDGVEFISNVDRANYLISELNRAALLETGKLVRKRMLPKARQQPGMRRSKRPLSAFQYWVRRRETDLVVGSKHNTWYGKDQELGTSKQPKRSIIKGTVMENLDDIRRVQGQYLSAIEQENRALGLIQPDEEGGNDTSD
jgi:HK97 gp10 family phage protein